MLAIKGVYDNGTISFRERVKTSGPVSVIITFLEEDVEISEQQFDLEKLSFRKSRELLKDLKSSLSDEVIEERRSEL
ncbi:MAG: hypothetical protein GY795_48960 [Desulfobacterales bacterium]|nr:hypothetical protein [Desulfobacterales bacterium]